MKARIPRPDARSRTAGVGRLTLAAALMLAAASIDLFAAAPPLVEAVKEGQIETVRALLAKRVDPNAAEADGTTALHWAAHLDNKAVRWRQGA